MMARMKNIQITMFDHFWIVLTNLIKEKNQATALPRGNAVVLMSQDGQKKVKQNMMN